MTKVAVDYRQEDGWHIFTSEEVPNLFVAHKDRLIAYNDVAKVLAWIFQVRDGVECHFEPESAAEDFFVRARSRFVLAA